MRYDLSIKHINIRPNYDKLFSGCFVGMHRYTPTLQVKISLFTLGLIVYFLIKMHGYHKKEDGCLITRFSWDLKKKSHNFDPPQFYHYNCTVSLPTFDFVKSFIILCIFMFYKQHVLADFWSPKDSAVGVSKLFIAHSMCTVQWHMHHSACNRHKSGYTQIGVLFASEKAIFFTYKYTWEWECRLVMFRFRVCVRYPI